MNIFKVPRLTSRRSTKMQSAAQKQATLENFKIFQLRGLIGNLWRLTSNERAAQIKQLLNEEIQEIKAQQQARKNKALDEGGSPQ